MLLATCLLLQKPIRLVVARRYRAEGKVLGSGLKLEARVDLVPDSAAASVYVVLCVREDLKLNATPFWIELADHVSSDSLRNISKRCNSGT